MNILARALLSTVVLSFVSSIGWTAVTSYDQDFESMATPSTGALLGDNWLVFANVYDATGTYLYGYGPFPAPNDGAAFCAVATGQGGTAQGDQQLSVYSDYNNPDHGIGRLIESNVFQEQTIAEADVGTVVVFTFQAKIGNLAGASEAEAFIKTLNPVAGYATTNHITVDMTTAPSTWNTTSIQLAIDGGLVGQILQFGFTTVASYYEASGVYYDNVMVEAHLFLDGFETGDLSAWSGWSPDAGGFVDGSTTGASTANASWLDRRRISRGFSEERAWAGSFLDRTDDSPPSSRSDRPPTMKLR
jgi:hypothetical protein